jgi:hypothetical protein
MKLENVVFANSSSVLQKGGLLSSGCSLELKRCSFVGAPLVFNGEILAEDSLFLGGSGVYVEYGASAQQRASSNAYALESLRFKGKVYAATDFQAYQELSGQDKSSLFHAAFSAEELTAYLKDGALPAAFQGRGASPLELRKALPKRVE